MKDSRKKTDEAPNPNNTAFQVTILHLLVEGWVEEAETSGAQAVKEAVSVPVSHGLREFESLSVSTKTAIRIVSRIAG